MYGDIPARYGRRAPHLRLVHSDDAEAAASVEQPASVEPAVPAEPVASVEASGPAASVERTAPARAEQRRSSARDRFVIVPLEPKAPAASAATRPTAAPSPTAAPPLAPQRVVDRRQQWPGRQPLADPFARLSCERCGTRARIDLVDPLWGRVHLSCDTCFRMWQDRIRVGDRPYSAHTSTVHRLR